MERVNLNLYPEWNVFPDGWMLGHMGLDDEQSTRLTSPDGWKLGHMGWVDEQSIRPTSTQFCITGILPLRRLVGDTQNRAENGSRTPWLGEAERGVCPPTSHQQMTEKQQVQSTIAIPWTWAQFVLTQAQCDLVSSELVMEWHPRSGLTFPKCNSLQATTYHTIPYHTKKICPKLL
jgi:hypothetical protein